MTNLGSMPEDTKSEERVDDSVQELVTAARLYYEDELSQQEIAVRLKKSRPTISRMLKAARSQGIVTIDIRAPYDRSRALEQALHERFGLDAVRTIVMPRGELDSTARLGRAAANYLQTILRDGLRVGVSNGRTLAATARYLRPERSLDLTIVQIIGALGSENPRIDGPDIARSLAEAYDTECRYLHVPLLVESAAVKDTLTRDRNIGQTLKMGAEADIALIGVGSIGAGRELSPIFDGFLSTKDMQRLRAAGAVGHVCGEFYRLDGSKAEIDINDRTIGIGLDALRKVPTVIGIAGGAAKAEAIVGAIHGGLISTLITDDRAAVRMLEMEDS